MPRRPGLFPALILLVSCAAEPSAPPLAVSATAPQAIDSTHRMVVALDTARFTVDGGPAGFGEVRHALILDDRSVVLLDPPASALFRYDSAGRLLGRAGGPGAGPGDLASPLRVVAAGHDTIIVFEDDNRRESWFRPAPDGLAFIKALPTSTWWRGFCRQGDTTIAAGFDRGTGTVLMRVVAGTVVGRFGAPWHEHPAFDRGGGPVLCLDTPRMLIASSEKSGRLRRYDARDSLVWHVQLADFLSGQHTVPGRPELTAFGLEPGQPRFDYVLAIFAVGPDHILLQLGIRTTKKAPPGTLDGIDSRLIRLRDGAEVGRQSNLPMVIAVRGGLLVTMTQTDEGPVVSLRRFALTPSPPLR